MKDRFVATRERFEPVVLLRNLIIIALLLILFGQAQGKPEPKQAPKIIHLSKQEMNLIDSTAILKAGNY